jgi:hypothetical protein
MCSLLDDCQAISGLQSSYYLFLLLFFLQYVNELFVRILPVSNPGL